MSTASQAWEGDALRRLPKPILQKMHGLIRQVRRVAICKGVLAVAATGLVCLLAIMAVDAAVTIFSPALRWALSLSGLAITAAAAWWWVFRPATQRITLASIARFVEQRHPELQETLSSAIELLTSDDPDEIRGSRELIGEVVKVAEQQASRVSPAREVDTAAMRKSAMAALTFAGLLALVFTFWPSPARRLMIRAVAPFMEIGNAYADTLTVEPGDVRVAKGADLNITASVKHPRLNRATVRRVDAGSKVEGVERMTFRPGQGERREFVLTFPNVTADFTYRVHAGNALSRFYQVTAVEPPRVEGISVKVEPPIYTGLAASTIEWKGEEVVVPEYANVTFQAKLNRDAGEAKFLLAEKPVPLEDPADAVTRSWIVSAVKGLKADWRIELKDAEGFGNDPTRGAIRATPDQVPAVQITSPETEEMRLRPDEILPLVYGVTEDFGFVRSELIVEIDGKPEPVILPQALPGRAGEGWRGQATLELATLGVVSGQVLRVRVRVADSLPEHLQGPQIGESERLVIRLDNGAKAMVEQVVQSQQQEIQRELNEVRQDLREAKALNEQLRREMQQPQGLTPRALERLDQTRKDMEAAEETLSELAAKMEPTLFQESARKMAEIAEEQIKPAMEKLEMIPLSDSKQDRLASSNEISKKIDEALKSVDKIYGELGKATQVAQQMVQLNDLAKRQDELAEAAAEQIEKNTSREAMTPDNPQAAAQAEQQAERDMREWQRQQQQVEAKLAEMLKQSPEALAEALQEQQKEAAKIAEKSQELAKQQAQLKEAAAKMTDPKAAQALKGEVMKQLQSVQQAIAQESGELRKEMSKEEAKAAPKFDQLLAEAAKSAAEAAKQMQKANLSPASNAAAKAMNDLKQASEASARASAEETMRQEAQSALEKALPAQTESTPEMREALRKAAEAVAKEAMQAPPGAMSLDKVRQAAEQAASPLADPAKANPESVAEAGRQAAQMLEAMQPPGQDNPQADPVPAAPANPMAAAKLSELSERQEKVAEALDALNRGQAEEAMAALQKAITDDAMQLLAQAESMERSASLTRQQQAQSFADQAGRQFQQAFAQSKAAGQLLEQAQMIQDQAQATAARAANPSMPSDEAMAKAQSGQLPASPASPAEQQRVEQARQAQQRAQDALTMASQRLSETGQAMAQAAKNAQQAKPNAKAAAPAAPVEAKNLAQSFEQASQAARAADPSQAAAQARQAAQSLSQMARQAAQSLGGMSDVASANQQSPDDGRPNDEAANTPASRGAEMRKSENVAGDGVPPELAKLGISMADWARIKSSLGSETTSQAASGAPKEYRDMVSDYFRIIATEAKK
jgi:hypothetical protein